MKILHVCNWVGGITTRNVAELKKHSNHNHELVVKVDHCYDMATEPAHLTEKNTTKEMVLDLAAEASVLHFHAVGYAGAAGLPGTIHGIDWSQFLGKKKFVFHGMVSDLQPDGSWIKRHGDRFEVPRLHDYDALFGPHLSCQKTYDDRLMYVPDMIPIYDWLYTPAWGPKEKIAATFKDNQVVAECWADGVSVRLIPTPTKLTEQLAWRRKNCKATFDNCTDGHWGLFGIESLSQGIPCVAHTNELNSRCWELLDVPSPPFFECKYGGADVPDILFQIFNMSELEWMEHTVAARGWVQKHYNPINLTERWDDCYDRLAKS